MNTFPRINIFLRAPAWQALLEACAGVFLYAFLFMQLPVNTIRAIFETSIDEALVVSLIIVILLCTLWAAVRIRISQLAWWQHLLRNAGVTLILGGVLSLGLWLLADWMGWLEVLAKIPDSEDIFAVPAISVLLFYPLFRLGVHLGLIWQRRSRRSMVLWLTNTILAVVAVMIVGMGLLPSILFLIPGFLPDVDSPYANYPWGLLQYFFKLVVPSILGALLMTLIILLLLLPFAILFSFLVARRTTQRVAQLAQATAAFRAGGYAVRVPVDGEDEVARLQSDFNAMAAQLSETLTELKSERDTVTQVLQARRDLVAGVSHELRTPVATLRAAVETTLSVLPAQDGPDVRERLELMEKEIERLSGLIDDLFTLSQAEVNNLRVNCAPTELAPLIEQVSVTFAPLAWQSGRVEVSADLTESLPRVQADADRLKQVLLNLLRNAVRHTPPGGIVAILAECESEHVRIDVRDTGEGIDPDDLLHIWERFYRGKNASIESAGLGLALVKELVEAMGGTVSVESTPGEGSCFAVRLAKV